jgi:Rieske Fe-S protein
MGCRIMNDQQSSRRAFLKVLAGAPMAAVVLATVSPVMRFLKPSMQPCNIFQPADVPTARKSITFNADDFPRVWTVLPFVMELGYVEFNPEKVFYKKMLGFAIRLPDDSIMAVSRICPTVGCILNYIPDPADVRHCLGFTPDAPVLHCPCDHSTFDLANGAVPIAGPARRAPRMFVVQRTNNTINIVGMEQCPIAG